MKNSAFSSFKRIKIINQENLSNGRVGTFRLLKVNDGIRSRTHKKGVVVKVL